MEHVRVLADDLRSVNEHRRMQSDVSRARLFKAHCLCRLREIVESSAIHCGDFLELHRAERALIADASCGSTLTQIDQALERFCTDLRRLEEEALERDRRRMADLPFQNIVGAKASPHRKLITVRIRTFSGAEFQVRCALDPSLKNRRCRTSVCQHDFCVCAKLLLKFWYHGSSALRWLGREPALPQRTHPCKRWPTSARPATGVVT